jgi:trans-2,3-dihydro-3-hydroxyanthranilate isomerase
MERHYTTVDVFTDRMFGGNPLAVVLDAQGLAAAQMQAIAAEFNYAETTFVLPPSNPSHSAQVRIFTPRSEVPFAGHPNVGTAFVLAQGLAGAGQPLPERFEFEEKAGLVPVRILKEGTQVVGAELTAPEPLSRGAEVSAEAAGACLTLPASEIAGRAHAPRVVSVGLPFLVAEVATREALARSRPDLGAHEKFLPGIGVDAIFAYVRDKDHEGTRVLHARMYAPLDGIPEDPATGSATAATLALLTDLDPRPELEQRWRVHQGDDMGRASVLLGATAKRAGQLQYVRVGGRCAQVMTGTLNVDP